MADKQAPASEYSDETIAMTTEDRPASKMRYKKPGTMRKFYRGGPYAGLTTTDDGKQTHSAEAAKRDDPTPKEPVSKRVGPQAAGMRQDTTDRSYRTFTQKGQFDSYVAKNDVTTPEKWDHMSITDRKGWLDENT